MDLWRRLTGAPRPRAAVTWQEACERWLNEQQLSPKSRRLYRCAIQRCYRALGFVLLCDTQPSSLGNYAEQLRGAAQRAGGSAITFSTGQRPPAGSAARTLAVGTINAHLTGLRRFHSWCAAHGWLDAALEERALASLLANIPVCQLEASGVPPHTRPLDALLVQLTTASPWRLAETERNVGLFALAWLTGATPTILSGTRIGDVRQESAGGGPLSLTIQGETSQMGTRVVRIARDDAPALYACLTGRLHAHSGATPPESATANPDASDPVFTSRTRRAGSQLSEQQVRRVLHEAAGALGLPARWREARVRTMSRPRRSQGLVDGPGVSGGQRPRWMRADDTVSLWPMDTADTPRRTRRAQPSPRAAKGPALRLGAHLAAHSDEWAQLDLWGEMCF